MASLALLAGWVAEVAGQRPLVVVAAVAETADSWVVADWHSRRCWDPWSVSPIAPGYLVP